MWNAGLDEAQTGIKISRRNINNLRNADNTTLMAETKEELQSLLMRVKEQSEKNLLKTLYSQPAWLQTILQSYSHQDSMILAQKQKYKPTEQDREPRTR